MKHYTKEELELYRNGQMSVLGRITCTSHLRKCNACAGVMGKLKEEDDFIAELRSSIQQFQKLFKSNDC